MTSADEFGLWIPGGFVDVPHLDDPELLLRKLREVVDSVGADAPPHEREALLTLYRTGYGQLLREGAVYVGYGYFRTSGGGLSTAALTVLVKDHPEASPYLIASQVARSHMEGGPAFVPGMTADLVELPCGPAVFVTRTTAAPEGLTAAGPLAWQVQAVVPFPQGRRVVVVDLSTPCPAEAAHYALIVHGIAGTITFRHGGPGPRSGPPTPTEGPNSRIEAAFG